MTSKAKWLIGAAIVLALGVAVFELGGPSPGPAGGGPTGYTVGATAPGFSLPDHKTGQNVSLSDYQGKVVLVNFWATWCPPCRAEIPDFIQVRNALQPQGFEILGLSVDAGGAADVTPFAKEFGITYPVLIADQDTTAKYGGVRGIPNSFLVDRQGRIKQVWTGAIDRQTLEQAVKPLL